MSTGLGIYTARFKPLSLPANTTFYVVLNNYGPDGGLVLPIEATGEIVPHFQTSGATWGSRGKWFEWNYGVLCCGSQIGWRAHVPDQKATSGTCNLIPFGTAKPSGDWGNQRYQTLATKADLAGLSTAIISNLAFASCGSGSQIQHFDSIEIKLAQTNATTLSPIFANNLRANVQTVLISTDYDWHCVGGQFSRIGLQTNYAYDASLGANIVLDICVTGNRKLAGSAFGFHGADRPRVYSYGWTGRCPTAGKVDSSNALKWCLDLGAWSLNEYGVGCQGSNGIPKLSLTGSGAMGQTMSVDLSNAPISGNAWLALGVGALDPGLDLGFLGAPGCLAYHKILFAVPVRIPVGAGSASIKVPVPDKTSFFSRRFYLQWWCIDPSARGGLTTSNWGLLIPGL